MAYLNCPTCRLTVYSPTASATSEECPRCRAKLGQGEQAVPFRHAAAAARRDPPPKSVRERAGDEAIAG